MPLLLSTRPTVTSLAIMHHYPQQQNLYGLVTEAWCEQLAQSSHVRVDRLLSDYENKHKLSVLCVQSAFLVNDRYGFSTNRPILLLYQQKYAPIRYRYRYKHSALDDRQHDGKHHLSVAISTPLCRAHTAAPSHRNALMSTSK